MRQDKDERAESIPTGYLACEGCASHRVETPFIPLMGASLTTISGRVKFFAVDAQDFRF